MAYTILGLGNPGGEYAHTRHNAGRMAVEAFMKEAEFDDVVFKKTANALISEGVIEGEKVLVALPETFMNNSGKSAVALVKSKKAAEHLLVVRDDLDLPLGAMKMTFARGSGGHKGIESIARALRTNDFAQLKLGISGAGAKGNVKKPKGEDAVMKYVIGKFSPKEDEVLKKVLKKAALVQSIFVTEGIEKAMLEANTK